MVCRSADVICMRVGGGWGGWERTLLPYRGLAPDISDRRVLTILCRRGARQCAWTLDRGACLEHWNAGCPLHRVTGDRSPGRRRGC